MQFKYRIATAISAGAIMMNLMAPAAFASTTVEISGNGSKSNNTANVTNNETVNVTQNNTLNVTTTINSVASTGGNKASGNTGGDVSVKTGNANSTASLNVTAGHNLAVYGECGCEQSDDSITIKDNGRKSDNKSIVNNTKKKTVSQKTKATVTAGVFSKAKTGKNKANDNTNGTVDVDTGDSDSAAIVDVTGPSNVISPSAQ